MQCYHCGGEKVVKSGRTRNGKQRFKCRACGRSLRENVQSQGYSEERKEEILRAYHERTSLRGLTRIFGVRARASRRGSKKFVSLPGLETTLETFQEGDELELDEIWSFVKRRKNKRWIWLALCRRTRQIVAFAIGNRGKKTCLLLWKAIPAAYKKAHCFADIWEAYSKVIEAQQLTQSESKTNTNHVERFNCTLRQRLGRLVRETFSFSKTDQMHNVVLTLFLHAYNRAKLFP
jgi:IS1 family transposase/predicted Fe-S protein YdhL (DUF1289 family)